ncbi:MAG: urea ABC transporter ATP-binding subunit UrtE [Gammaproteobacteria bacterium]|nr:urea ABC transporter ATP-binding subunit UrtE [Gammaproteobacteria bacterium]
MGLEVQGIDTFYGTSHILHGVTLSVPDGAMISVLGRNGVGKSTLLKSIIGINPPQTGTIHFNDADVTKEKTHEHVRAGISYIPQGREIIPDISVYENLVIAMRGKNNRSNQIPAFIFEYFPALEPIQKRKGGILSGGQQQQLAIARALIQEPNLLLMDEPTEGLQPSVVAEIDTIIKRIHTERNCSILLIEQNLDFIRDVTQQFAIMDSGQIVEEGNIEKLTDEFAGQYLSV